MRSFRKGLFIVITALFICAGFYGCAKKQLNTGGGELKSQQPQAAKEMPAKNTSKSEAKEVPPGPKEQPAPVEAAHQEKALNDIHFAFDSYDITSPEGNILQSDVKWIKSNTPGHILIEGNCDERGTVEYNLALGQRRADAAEKYLVSLGISQAELKTISYGKSKPVDAGHTEEAWAKNRRDHFVVQ
jgi:peptidoglycan-associated lipoprotein